MTAQDFRNALMELGAPVTGVALVLCLCTARVWCDFRMMLCLRSWLSTTVYLAAAPIGGSGPPLPLIFINFPFAGRSGGRAL